MNFRKGVCFVVLAGILGTAFGQDEKMLDKTSHQRMEQQMNKHRQQVVKKLVTLPHQETVFDFLSFDVQGPTVVLLGFTIQPVLKTGAEGSIKQLEWVEHVVNEIQVLPLNPEDRQLRSGSLAVLEQLLPQSFPEGHADLRIKVMRGDITLVGYIGAFQKKFLEAAIVQIQHLPLVREVKSEVAVKAK